MPRADGCAAFYNRGIMNVPLLDEFRSLLQQSSPQEQTELHHLDAKLSQRSFGIGNGVGDLSNRLQGVIHEQLSPAARSS